MENIKINGISFNEDKVSILLFELLGYQINNLNFKNYQDKSFKQITTKDRITLIYDGLKEYNYINFYDYKPKTFYFKPSALKIIAKPIFETDLEILNNNKVQAFIVKSKIYNLLEKFIL